MYFQRYYLECLSHASYMVADEETKIAAVIDPQRDIDIYLKDAQEHGFEIKHVILTHFHADFVAGHIELRNRVGARIYLGSKGDAEFEHTKLSDDDRVELGSVYLSTLETPGHTPEGITMLVFDPSYSTDEPYAALTGDTLFIGDVGRPDLLASIGVTADELGNMLYDSLHEKLLKLPDATRIYPAHGAGSLCGKALSSEPFSTLGEQRKYNYALQPMSREEFLRIVTAAQPDAPDYFVHDAIMNRKDRASLDESMQHSLQALSLTEVLEKQAAGAQVVDTRDPIEFAGAHLRGALNIGIDGKYATWAGTMLNKTEPIVVIADEERVEESILRLGRIGFDQVVGYLKEGMDALNDRPDLVARTSRITAPAVKELEGDVVVLDIRNPKEYDDGHIEGSLNIPLNHLEERFAEIPSADHLVVHCAGGYRSSIGASLLLKLGRSDVLDMVGGFKAWEASHLPVATSA
ncbi:MBL fold metallo-hydrolase [Bremerella cremea]|uniref:MBL fold metallo-hydrolase n=1 Tax=Blastopirellula marina TaxID=124 RepID=A0A2S8FW23_9BACT|nr:MULTISPECIES: MBL fold metallo-hydrolase [Pirellulaceae]PQO36379.1 MBL fold metallo-hydrolase [Blastopirellula marina]RCS49057.1 MBL fold metallo-hydrolase [Bremerella cremea]